MKKKNQVGHWLTQVCLGKSFSVLMTIFRGEPGLAGFTGAKDSGSGGDNSSCKTCKAIVKLSPPTNQHPTFYRPDTLPVVQPTVSSRSTWENGNLRSVCVCVCVVVDFPEPVSVARVVVVLVVAAAVVIIMRKKKICTARCWGLSHNQRRCSYDTGLGIVCVLGRHIPSSGFPFSEQTLCELLAVW